MKSVLISIQPYWVFLIIAKKMGWYIDHEKTVEVRKNFPKDLGWDKKSIIYCSKNKRSFDRIPKKYQPFMEKFLGKVIGEFVCDEITEYEGEFYDDETYENIKRVIHTTDWDGYPERDYIFIAEDGEENSLCKSSCLAWEELRNYMGKGINIFYGWHISDLVIYDKPRELGEFWNADKCPYASKDGCTYKYHCFRAGQTKRCGSALTRPPQSWCYVESEDTK